MNKQARLMISSAIIAGLTALYVVPVMAQQTAKVCEDEWEAKKASLEAKGTKKKDFIEECRTKKPKAMTPATAPTGAHQFSSETLAKVRCPRDTVVWANLESKIYHFSGNKDYGHTEKGAYMCEKDAGAEGFRAAKDEKHP